MKISLKHREHMRESIDYYFDNLEGGREGLVEKYETGNFQNAHLTKNLQKRFCFDVLHNAGLTGFVCAEIYTYANDEHIFAVLRKICPVVKKRY